MSLQETIFKKTPMRDILYESQTLIYLILFEIQIVCNLLEPRSQGVRGFYTGEIITGNYFSLLVGMLSCNHEGLDRDFTV